MQVVQTEFVARKGFQLGTVTLRVRLGTHGQIAQKAHHFIGALRHLGSDGIVRVAGEAEQLCQLGAQGQNAIDVGAVVQRGIAKFGRALGIGAIQQRAQLAAVRIGLHRQIARHLQGEFPTWHAVLFCGSACRSDHFGRQP